MAESATHLVLFFTWDVSLAIWKEKGLLEREIKLYQELANHGVNVTFLSWGGKEDEEIAKTLSPKITTISIYNHIPRPKNKVLRAFCSLLIPWTLRKKLKEADLYKTNQMWGSWTAVFSSLFFRKPLIARCGFELYDFTVKQGHGWARKNFVWLISRITYGISKRICVATQEDKNFVVQTFGQKEEKISLHPNWIDTGVFAPQKLERKDKHILFVGRLSKQKNLETLLDALKDSNFTLDIIGQGELEEALKQQAKENNVVVQFLGSLPNDQLPTAYNSYPVFILPSHYEGNPKTLLEAMACGAAVIGTNVPGIASVIQHEKTGLLCESNAQSIREAIEHLITNDNLRNRLGQGAQEQIIATQTLDKLIDKELACYNSIKDKA